MENKPATAKHRPRYWWLIAFVLLWPVTLAIVSMLRFGGLPSLQQLDVWNLVSGAVGFGLLGLLSGWLVLKLARARDARAVRIGTLLGYLLAAPVGFVGGLIGPLFFEVQYPGSISRAVTYLLLFPLGVAVFGTIPLVAGAGIGFALGSAIAARKAKA
ncbi:MAG: hypothetical protein U0514_03005 [Candidatus Andersenbacteria bacterium]